MGRRTRRIEPDGELTKILPTSTCFDDALDTLFALLTEHPEDTAIAEQVFLVHGIVHPAGYPRMAHAWLEDDQEHTVIFSGIIAGEKRLLLAQRTEYYANMQPEEVTRYTYSQAFVNNRLSGHYGPWKPAYRALCRNP